MGRDATVGLRGSYAVFAKRVGGTWGSWSAEDVTANSR
jgi:hypothetical protein